MAGPVFAAAVIFHPGQSIEGVRDSKVLSSANRELLAARIKQQALAWAVAEAVGAFGGLELAVANAGIGGPSYGGDNSSTIAAWGDTARRKVTSAAIVLS